MKSFLGIIGGSDVDQLQGIEDLRKKKYRKPVGQPSTRYGLVVSVTRRRCRHGRHARGKTGARDGNFIRTIAMVTDFDSWHPDHDVVSAASVIRVAGENRDMVAGLVLRLARDFPMEHEACPIGSDTALDDAVMKALEAGDPALLAKHDAMPAGYLTLAKRRSGSSATRC